MGATTGIQPIGDYAGAANNVGRIDRLLALIPDPDTTNSSGATAGPPGVGAGFLDEMSPAAATQLRVELTAMRSVTT